MDISSEISALLADKNMPVDTEWALAILDKHPTFVVLGALLLSRNSDLLDPDTKKKLQAKVALGCADRAAACDLADLAGCDWAEFYPAPEEPEQRSTVDTIDKFIDTYGHQSANEAELLEKLIFNPVPPDYLEAQERSENEKKAGEIEDAGSKAAAEAEPAPPAYKAPAEPEPPAYQAESEAEPAPPAYKAPAEAEPAPPAYKAPAAADPKPRKPKAAEGASKEDLFAESLAKIFIKQRRYERALEIISNLSLNYPEKSAYFADQIRFLQMLVYNQQKKQK